MTRNVTMDTIIHESNHQGQYLFDQYPVMQNSHDEFFTVQGEARDQSKQIVKFFNGLSAKTYHQHHQTAIKLFKEYGVTFGTHADNEQNPFPFDLIPRIIPNQDWHSIVRGLEQRTKAMNAFLFDIYHQQHILKDKIIPRELIESSSYYLPQLQHITPPGGVYIHVSGIDIVHDTQGNYLVLEDNLALRVFALNVQS